MSGRNRKGGVSREQVSAQQRAATVEQGPGNAAQQQSVHDLAHGLGITRDLALPQIEHVIQAMQIPHRTDAEQDRMVEILRSSELKVAEVDALVAHLQESQAQAVAVAAAASELSEGLQATLHQLHDDLVQGSAGVDGWSRADGQAVSVAGTTASDLMGALVDSRGASASQILAFVQRVHLSVFLDEEEELEIPADYESQTSGA